MFPLLSALALAADPAVVHPGPYEVLEDAAGRLKVKDAEGAFVPTADALWLASGPAVASDYRAGRRVRKSLAFVMWVGGMGTATLGILLGGASDNVPVATGTGAFGLAVVGAGYGLLYGHASERLDYWVTADALRIGLADATTTADAAEDAEDEPPIRPSRRWKIDDRGVPRGAHGERLRVLNVALALGDEETLRAYHRWQREQYATWSLVGATGTALVIVGLQQADYQHGERRVAGGYATAALGTVLMGTGVVGLAIVERPQHTRVWFTDAELQEAVDVHNQSVLGPSAPAPTVVLRPVLSPTWVGLTGTF